MIKHTNPFYTIDEALAVLKNLGADPHRGKSSPGATYPFPWGNSYGAKPEEPVYWQEHVLGIMVQSVYTKGTHHYVIEIHLDREGFDTVYGIMRALADEAPELLKKDHSDEYDMYYIEPGSLLRLFKLVPKEESK